MATWGFLSIVGVIFGLGACGTDGQVHSSSSLQGADSGTRSGGASGAGSPGSGGTASGGVAGSGGAPSGGGTSAGGTTGSGGEGTAGAGGTGGTSGPSNSAVDLYVLFDQTNSMGCPTAMGGSRFQRTKDGFLAFLQSPAADGLGVGMNFWMIGDTVPSCLASDYAKPEVEISPLPGSRTAIGNALSAHAPSSMTGPGPVLKGGVDHAATWATAHPGRKVAVVLVADGTFASVCKDTDPVAVARAAFMGVPSVRTYVLGLVDGVTTRCSLDPTPATAADFDPIAVAGGTTAAFIAQVGTEGTQSVTDAFLAIAAAAAR